MLLITSTSSICISEFTESSNNNSVILINKIGIILFISYVISFLSAETFHSRNKSWLIEANIRYPSCITWLLLYTWTIALALCFKSLTLSSPMLKWKGLSLILNSSDFKIGLSSGWQLLIATWSNIACTDFAIFLAWFFCLVEVRLLNSFKTFACQYISLTFWSIFKCKLNKCGSE